MKKYEKYFSSPVFRISSDGIPDKEDASYQTVRNRLHAIHNKAVLAYIIYEIPEIMELRWSLMMPFYERFDSDNEVKKHKRICEIQLEKVKSIMKARETADTQFEQLEEEK